MMITMELKMEKASNCGTVVIEKKMSIMHCEKLFIFFKILSETMLLYFLH